METEMQKGRSVPAFSLFPIVSADGHVAARRSNYMFEIMTSPKPEQDTWVAPSIRRAKS
jgi:hypothetical protein